MQSDRLYLTAAYELHKNVNRTSDLANLDPRDVGDESAFKVGGAIHVRDEDAR